MNNKPNYDLLYEIAESQAGYFTSRQAGEAGFSWDRLSKNVKKGIIQRVFRSVYRLVHFPGSRYEDLFVAYLRTSLNAVISHQSALMVYNLSDVLPEKIHLIVPRSSSRRHSDLHLHTNKLSRDEITSREGLPITTAARTIADVAVSHLPEEQVHQAIREALQRGLVTKEELQTQANRRKGRAKRIIEAALTLDEE